MTTTQEIIRSFTGQYRFLSNFYLHTVMVGSSWAAAGYRSNEHAYQANKTLDRAQHDWVAASDSPGEAKRRGRQVELRFGWNEHLKYTVMEALIGYKFSDVELSSQLAATGVRVLIEGNKWHDQIWGDCSCGHPTCQDVGANLLGWMLMRRRALVVSSL